MKYPVLPRFYDYPTVKLPPNDNDNFNFINIIPCLSKLDTTQTQDCLFSAFFYRANSDCKGRSNENECLTYVRAKSQLYGDKCDDALRSIDIENCINVNPVGMRQRQ